MFSNLSDFTFTRNLKQALGFYIVYLAATLLIAGILGASISMKLNAPEGMAGRIGNYTACVLCAFYSLRSITDKKLYKDPICISLGVATPFATYFVGGVGGMVLCSALTMFGDKPKKSPSTGISDGS